MVNALVEGDYCVPAIRTTQPRSPVRFIVVNLNCTRSLDSCLSVGDKAFYLALVHLLRRSYSRACGPSFQLTMPFQTTAFPPSKMYKCESEGTESHITPSQFSPHSSLLSQEVKKTMRLKLPYPTRSGQNRRHLLQTVLKRCVRPPSFRLMETVDSAIDPIPHRYEHIAWISSWNSVNLPYYTGDGPTSPSAGLQSQVPTDTHPYKCPIPP